MSWCHEWSGQLLANENNGVILEIWQICFPTSANAMRPHSWSLRRETISAAWINTWSSPPNKSHSHMHCTYMWQCYTWVSCSRSKQSFYGGLPGVIPWHESGFDADSYPQYLGWYPIYQKQKHTAARWYRGIACQRGERYQAVATGGCAVRTIALKGVADLSWRKCLPWYYSHRSRALRLRGDRWHHLTKGKWGERGNGNGRGNGSGDGGGGNDIGCRLADYV